MNIDKILNKAALVNNTKVHENLSIPNLVNYVLAKDEGVLSDVGAISVITGKYTGRSPKDRFIVLDDVSRDTVDFNNTNKAISEEHFQRLYRKVIDHLSLQKDLFRLKAFAGADKNSQLSIQVINEYAWHNIFAQQLFILPTNEELNKHKAEFTVLAAPNCFADPTKDGTNSETFIVISLKEKTILIGGTEYAGEIKKSIFSIMNYLLPDKDILPMHCSANVGADGDVALFFGLSGTGKTTLSTSKDRKLIGDDEHGWSKDGVFNIEGGCYAKTVKLNREAEPEIYDAIRFGTILENVILDPVTSKPDYDDISLTENTRAAYSLDNIDNALLPSVAGQPSKIIFLTADASGVLPPVSKLDNEQAMYHFLSGYTSKLAGTERGITEPEKTFSACFGAPFLPLNPTVYANMLGDKIARGNISVYLVNTGWSGGTYNTADRIALKDTRAIIDAILNGELEDVDYTNDNIFKLNIPNSVTNVDSNILDPRLTWNDKDLYDQTALELAKAFKANFEENFKSASAEISAAGPSI
ncbi:MAG: phosphoenolpyruvate carboxykinase (ATP) [Erysipelothrix sp.]|nr:phosphoenolpyruvate carboxykinase (ATP) [Erysipelothrix sp.]